MLASSDAAESVLAISEELRIAVRGGRDVELQVRPADDDTSASIAERFTGSANHAEELERINATGATGATGSKRKKKRRSRAAERWLTIPLRLATAEYRHLVLKTLFPADRHDGEDWIHVVRSGVLPTYDEGLWQVAEWFTGSGDTFTQLMAANRLSSPELRSGQRLRIPGALLHAAFRPRLVSADGALEYDRDEDGPYAVYHLEEGEALYSAVILRFTGRTAAADVQQVAATLKQRSQIQDLTDIPVGYPIKIPLDLLEPDFLPPSHPRRREADAARQALAQELERQPLPRGGLRDVLVILDPGHGGLDLGTMNNGIWEHDYVYDITCRLKQMLETSTEADVRLTLLDRETGCVPSKTDKLKANHQGSILTTPNFLAKKVGEARIGVNLRWYLANSIYRKALENGADADRVIFVSIHADSRHPDLRGVMVYVPGSAYRTRTYGSNSSSYRRYEEVREKPFVSVSKQKRVRSEAVSREFADIVVRSFRDADLPVQTYQPVRHRIIRGKNRYIPAVLRGNIVPNKVLVEMVNLSNSQDAALLASAKNRQRLAHALLESLLEYYGD